MEQGARSRRGSRRCWEMGDSIVKEQGRKHGTGLKTIYLIFSQSTFPVKVTTRGDNQR